MASYNQFNNNVKWDSMLVPILNCGTSIFAGFVVFSVLGFMSHQTGVPVSQVATGGPGLAFVTYPEALTLMPFPQIWSVLFFVMLFLLGLDTCFVQIEAIVTGITDEFPQLRKHKTFVTFVACFTMFLGSLIYITNGGMYVLSMIDWYAGSISVILICIVEVVIVGWIYGVDEFVRDLEFMVKEKISFWWSLCWKYITPIILMFIFMTTIVFNTPVTYNRVVYPIWAITLGWLSAVLSMMFIPGYIVYKLATSSGDCLKKIKLYLQPSSKWGPTMEEHRIAWEILKSEKSRSPNCL